MIGTNSSRSIRETPEAQYVTSSYLSETASIWGAPQIITRETIGQIINGIYVEVIPDSVISIEDNEELMQEIRMWEVASANDLLQIEKSFDEE